MAMASPQSDRWWKTDSMGSGDGLSRNTLSMDIPDTRTCREAREKSRKEMHVLNEKLASHLEKMRFLSEQNRKMMEDAEGSRGRISREADKIRQTYNNELKQLRYLVDECEREKADTLAQMASLQQTLRAKQEQNNQLAHSNQKLTQELDQALKDLGVKDADMASLERNMRTIADENDKLRATMEQAKQNNLQLHKSLNEETASRMACQSEMQTMREEMDFSRTVHEQELEELRAIASADHEQDRDKWRSEMQRALRDIQLEYDQRVDKIRQELEGSYENKLTELNKSNARQGAQFQELTNENNALKNTSESMRKRADQYRNRCQELGEAMNELQAECQHLHKKLEQSLDDGRRERKSAEDALNRAAAELSSLTDAKLNLESEIAAYRRLLEAQDSLFPADSPKLQNGHSNAVNGTKELRVRIPVYSNIRSNNRSQSVKDSVRWTERDEPSGQSNTSNLIDRHVEGSQQLSCSYSDSERVSASHREHFSRGQLAITECAPNGTFIEISNTGNVDLHLDNWCLVRDIDDGRRIIRYTLPNRAIPAHTSFRVWANGKMYSGSGLYDFEVPYNNWGVGNVIHTKLYNPEGIEKAIHTQTLD